jgi:hypothetical protein
MIKESLVEECETTMLNSSTEAGTKRKELKLIKDRC